MDIKILGGGCKNCNLLEKNTKEALTKLGLNDGIKKITETADIMALGVMRTPTLMINGKAVVIGRVAKTKEIVKIMNQND